MDIKQRKLLKITILGIGIFSMLVALTVAGINRYVIISARERVISQENYDQLNADCIMVLGAGVWGNRPSNMLEDRLLQGIELYQKGVSGRILMSGDHGRTDYDEVNTMKRFAIAKGVPSENIFMDHAGFDTYNSLYRARDVFQVDKAVIVTQEYHLYRALYIAEALGIEAIGVPSDLRSYAGQDVRDTREVLARVKDFFSVMLKPKPVYLGESIPISGDGDMTND